MKTNPLPVPLVLGLLVLVASTVHGGAPGFVMGLWAFAFILCGLIPILTGWWLYSAILCFFWFIGFFLFMVFMQGFISKDFGEGMWDTLNWYFSCFGWLFQEHNISPIVKVGIPIFFVVLWLVASIIVRK